MCSIVLRATKLVCRLLWCWCHRTVVADRSDFNTSQIRKSEFYEIQFHFWDSYLVMKSAAGWLHLTHSAHNSSCYTESCVPSRSWNVDMWWNDDKWICGSESSVRKLTWEYLEWEIFRWKNLFFFFWGWLPKFLFVLLLMDQNCISLRHRMWFFRWYESQVSEKDMNPSYLLMRAFKYCHWMSTDVVVVFHTESCFKLCCNYNHNTTTCTRTMSFVQ